MHATVATAAMAVTAVVIAVTTAAMAAVAVAIAVITAAMAAMAATTAAMVVVMAATAVMAAMAAAARVVTATAARVVAFLSPRRWMPLPPLRKLPLLRKLPPRPSSYFLSAQAFVQMAQDFARPFVLLLSAVERLRISKDRTSRRFDLSFCAAPSLWSGCPALSDWPSQTLCGELPASVGPIVG